MADRMTVGQLVAELALDAIKFTQGLQEASGKAKQFADQFTGVFVRSVNRAYSASAGLAAILGFGAGGLGVAVTQLGRQALELAGEWQSAEMAFTNFLGSAEKAKSFMADLSEFAARTPFELRGLRDAAQRLMQVNTAAQDVIPTLESIGNMMAASGKISTASLERVYYALGQISSAGRLMGQDAMQLTQAMIPVWDALAAKLGKTTAEVRKLSEEGKISAKTVFDALREFGQTEKYKGLTDAIVNTIPGKLSNLNDALDRFKAEFGKRIDQAFDIKDVISRFTKWIDTARESLEQGGLLRWFDEAKDKIGLVAAAIAGALTPAWIALTAATLQQLRTLAPWVAAGTAVYYLMQKWGVTLEDVARFVGRVIVAFQALAEGVTGAIKVGKATLQNFFAAIGFYGDALGRLLKSIPIMWEGAFVVPVREARLAFAETLNAIGWDFKKWMASFAEFIRPFAETAGAYLGIWGNALKIMTTALQNAIWNDFQVQKQSALETFKSYNAVLKQGIEMAEGAWADLRSGKTFDINPELFKQGLDEMSHAWKRFSGQTLEKAPEQVSAFVNDLGSKIKEAFGKVEAFTKVDYSQKLPEAEAPGEDEGKSKKDDPIIKRVTELAEKVQLLKLQWEAGKIAQSDYLEGLRKLLPVLDELYKKYGDNVERGIAILRLANEIRGEVKKDWEGESLQNTLNALRTRAQALTTAFQSGKITIEDYGTRMNQLITAVEALRETYGTTQERAVLINDTFFDLTKTLDAQKQAAQELADKIKNEVAEAYRIAADKATAWMNAYGYNKDMQEVQPLLDVLQAGLTLPLDQYEGAEFWDAFERLNALMQNPKTNPLVKQVVEPMFKVALERIQAQGRYLEKALEDEGQTMLDSAKVLAQSDPLGYLEQYLAETQPSPEDVFAQGWGQALGAVLEDIRETLDEARVALDEPVEIATPASIENLKRLYLALLPYVEVSEEARVTVERLGIALERQSSLLQGIQSIEQQATQGITRFVYGVQWTKEELDALNDELVQWALNERNLAGAVGDTDLLQQLKSRLDALNRIRAEMVEAGRSFQDIAIVDAAIEKLSGTIQWLTSANQAFKKSLEEDAIAARLLEDAQDTLNRLLGIEVDSTEQLINALRVKAVLDEKNAARYTDLANRIEEAWIQQKLKNQADEEAARLQKELEAAYQNTAQAIDVIGAVLGNLANTPALRAMGQLGEAAKVFADMMQDSARQVSHAEALARGFERAYTIVNALAGAVSALDEQLGKVVSSVGNLAVAGFQLGGPVGGAIGAIAGLFVAMVDIIEGGRRQIEEKLKSLSESFRIMSERLYDVAYRTEYRINPRTERKYPVKIFDEKIAEQLKTIAEPLEQGFSSAIANALKSVAMGEKDWQMAFRNAIRAALLEAFVAAFMQSAVFKNLLAYPMEEYVKALQAGNTEAAKQWLAVIMRAIPEVTAILEKAGLDIGGALGFEKLPEYERTLLGMLEKFRNVRDMRPFDFAKFEEAFLELADYLGASIPQLQSILKQAFSADTYKDFLEGFAKGMDALIRDVIVTQFVEGFEASAVLGQIRNLITEGVVAGTVDVEAIRQKVEYIKQIAKPVYDLLEQLGLLPQKAIEETTDRATQSLAQSLEQAFQVTSLEDFGKNLEIIVGKAVTNALIESFLAAAPVQAAIKGMADFIGEAVKDGLSADEMAGIQERIAALRELLGPMFEQVLQVMKSLGLIAAEVDEATRLAEERLSSIQGSLENAIAGAFNARNLEDFLTYLGESTNAVLRDAVIKAFMETAAVQSIVKTISMVISEAVIDGVLTASELQLVQGNLNLLREQLIPMFEMLDSLGILNGAFEDLNKTVEDTKEKIEEIGESLTNVPQWFKVGEARYFAANPMIPAFAEGGVVTRPTLALIGERGPEAVVPLDQVGGVHIHGDVYGFDDFKRKVWMAYEQARQERNHIRTGSRLRG